MASESGDLPGKTLDELRIRHAGQRLAHVGDLMAQGLDALTRLRGGDLVKLPREAFDFGGDPPVEILRNLLGEVPYPRLNLGDRLGERRDVGAAVGLRKIGSEAAHEVFESGHLFARDEVSEGGAQAPDLSLDALERGMPRVGRRVLPLEAQEVSAAKSPRTAEARPRDRSKAPLSGSPPGPGGPEGPRGHRPARRRGAPAARWRHGRFAEPGFGLFDPVGHRSSKGGAPGRVEASGAVAASGSKSTLARWRVTLAILARAASRSPWRARLADLLRRSAAALLDDRGRDPFVQAQARAPSGSFRRLAGLEIEACQGVASHAALKDRIRRQEDPAATVRRFRTIADQQREPGLRTDGAAFCERGKEAVKAS